MLRAPIERLARIDRSSCSTGERAAAEWIAEALRELGADAQVEPERVHGTYWWPLGITSSLGLIGAILARRRRPRLGAIVAAVAAAAAADDLSPGPRFLRRLLPKQTTTNVVAQAGDPDGDITVLLVSHHDAAHTGFFFNPKFTTFLGRFGSDADGAPRHPPIMAPIVLAPALVALGALSADAILMLGAGVCAAITVSLFEVALRETVPGANDNLSGVTTLLAVARALRERPTRGVRVLLVSTGAEEALMEGMRAFAEHHFRRLDVERTYVLCVDAVGSPKLVLAEAEGMLRLRRYDPEFVALIASCAEARGIKLTAGFEMRLGTDGTIALRHGYPAAMLTSVNEYGAAANYHWPTDTPDRLDYSRVSDTAELCEAVIRGLGEGRTAAMSEARAAPRAQPHQPAVP